MNINNQTLSEMKKAVVLFIAIVMAVSVNAQGQYGASCDTVHVVKRGEHLAQIARDYGMKLPELLRDNPAIAGRFQTIKKVGWKELDSDTLLRKNGVDVESLSEADLIKICRVLNRDTILTEQHLLLPGERLVIKQPCQEGDFGNGDPSSAPKDPCPPKTEDSTEPSWFSFDFLKHEDLALLVAIIAIILAFVAIYRTRTERILMHAEAAYAKYAAAAKRVE